MNTSKRGKIYFLFIILYFIAMWFYYNLTPLNHSIDTKRVLLTLNGEGSGFSFAISHGTINALFFLLLLIEYMPMRREQLLVRMERKNIFQCYVKKGMLISALFTLVFESIRMILTITYIDFSLLISCNYFLGVIVSFVMLSIYYTLVSLVYIMVYVSTSNHNISLFTTCLLFAVTGCLSYILRIWGPLEEIFVFDNLLHDTLSGKWVLFGIIKLMLLNAFFYCMGLAKFKEKDILSNEIQ